MNIDLPKMNYKRDGIKHEPIKTFQVNESTIIAVYPGSLSELDILIKYRQKLKSGNWSRIRTPKHIHWTVDILLKMQTYRELTQQFLDFFIDIWNNTKPLKNEAERQSLDLASLLKFSGGEIEKYKGLSGKGKLDFLSFESFHNLKIDALVDLMIEPVVSRLYPVANIDIERPVVKITEINTRRTVAVFVYLRRLFQYFLSNFQCFFCFDAPGTIGNGDI